MGTVLGSKQQQGHIHWVDVGCKPVDGTMSYLDWCLLRFLRGGRQRGGSTAYFSDPTHGPTTEAEKSKEAKGGMQALEGTHILMVVM